MKGRKITWKTLVDRNSKTLDEARYAYKRIQRRIREIIVTLLQDESDDPEQELADLLDLMQS